MTWRSLLASGHPPFSFISQASFWRLKIAHIGGQETVGSLTVMIPAQPSGTLWPLQTFLCFHAALCPLRDLVRCHRSYPLESHMGWKPEPFLTSLFGENQCYHTLPWSQLSLWWLRLSEWLYVKNPGISRGSLTKKQALKGERLKQDAAAKEVNQKRQQCSVNHLQEDCPLVRGPHALWKVLYSSILATLTHLPTLNS